MSKPDSELYRLAQHGSEEAKEELIRMHTGLVMMIASHYYGVIDREDAIQEGMIGLLGAIDIFNPDLGYQFSTLAFFKIRRALQGAVRANYSPIIVSQLARQRIKENKHHRFEKQARATLRVASLNEPLPNSDSELIDILRDTQAVDPEMAAIECSVRKIVTQAIDGLPERLKEIMYLRMGYGESCDVPLNQKEVSKLFGLTSQRISQLEQQAYELLEKNRDLKRLCRDLF